MLKIYRNTLQQQLRCFSSKSHSHHPPPADTPAAVPAPAPTENKGLLSSFLHGSNTIPLHNYQDTYTKHMARGKSIHELSTHNVKPEAMEDYKHLIKQYHAKISADPVIPARLFGSFYTEVGPLDQAVHLWEYENYQSFEDCNLLLSEHPEYKKFLHSLKPMLASRENQIVLEFAFWNAVIPDDTTAVYELRTYVLKSGRMLEWQESWKKGLMARKEFVTPVGAWFSQLGDLNVVHHLWSFPSLQKRKEMREKTWKVKGWGEALSQSIGLIDNMQSRILVPLVFANPNTNPK